MSPSDFTEQVRRMEQQRLDGPDERPEREWGDVCDEAYDRWRDREIDRQREG